MPKSRACRMWRSRHLLWAPIRDYHVYSILTHLRRLNNVALNMRLIYQGEVSIRALWAEFGTMRAIVVGAENVDDAVRRECLTVSHEKGEKEF